MKKTCFNSFQGLASNLYGNKLSGGIPPGFERLESMTSLNLSSNNLKGPIPIELSRIGNLDTLDLSNNKIYGSIPSSVGDLEHLLKLILSKNRLTGYILAEFGNLRSVMKIDLLENQLYGQIPQELGQLQNLFSLNVSYNNLAGDIPLGKKFSMFPPSSFVGNPGLCGPWVDSPCHNSHSPERASISKAAILGIALGALVILLMILVAACRPHNPPPFSEGALDKPSASPLHIYSNSCCGPNGLFTLCHLNMLSNV
ncbi:hypothetical protein IFM89_009288 [Coptis chinensis]|uniref:Leucine-rich repeat receptor-like protein kinase n=1 Tax=Coptis chinensis TaxID=261450 RepID=A0A835I3B9_9MAGN|nr:hypothetical protein IFM89_009288 [Coptis chinensis]